MSVATVIIKATNIAGLHHHNSYDVATKTNSVISTETCKVILPGW